MSLETTAFTPTPSIVISGRRIAVVVGGAECVWEEIEKAKSLSTNIDFIITNDCIPLFPGECIAATLHPDKVTNWLIQRHNNNYSEPSEIWTHEQSRHPNRLIKRLRDWGGSSGLFAAQVAMHRGHDRILLCGVPMAAHIKHVTRKSRWDACGAFVRAWDNHKGDLIGRVKSFSGWSKDLLGEPTQQWIEQP